MDLEVYATWQEMSPVVAHEDRGVYILIDVYKFSTTVIELLTNGARSVLPLKTPDSVVDQSSDTVEGGEYEHFENGDVALYNSPTFVGNNKELYEGKDVRFFSNNGAKAVHALPTKSDVLVGSTINARAVVRSIKRRNPKRVVFVCAGTLGRPTYEDLLAAALIKNILTGSSFFSLLRDVFRYAPSITTWFDPAEGQTEDTRSDIFHAMLLNRSTVVPVLQGDKFIPE